MTEPDAARREVLLVEYQKAQDSAEHHDNLVSSVTGLWLGSAVLMGFVLSTLTSKHLATVEVVALVFITVLGIALALLVLWWVERAVAIKQKKYDRCKAIERALGMYQHLQVPEGVRLKQRVYRVLITLFCATWVALLVGVFER